MTVHRLKSKCGGGGAMRVKIVLLLGFLLCFILAFPVESQSCGLPTSTVIWTSSTTQTTWNMTSNCTFSTTSSYSIRINSGTFTVNGNGYTITSDPNARSFRVAGGTLNLNNVTITGHTSPGGSVIAVAGRLNTNGVTLRNNTSNATISVNSGGRADLTNIRIQNNYGNSQSSFSSAMRVNPGGTANLENAIITGNSNGGYVIGVYSRTATLNITGCLTMSGNTGVNIASHTGGGGNPTISNNNVGACVGGGFNTATPTPLAGTATAAAAETATAAGTVTAEAEMTATAAAEMTGTAAAAMPGTATAAAAETATAAGTATAAAEMTATAAAAETATALAMTAEAAGTATAAAAETATVLAMTATATPTPTLTPMPRPRKKEKESLPPTPTATPRPAYAASYVALQTETGMTFEAAYGLDSGVHFRQLDGGGIGVQSIIDAGPLAALDVYGYVEQGVEICFPQIGRVIFLDARTMPRAITTLPATVRDGMTCVYLDSPGSLVLLPN